MDCLPILDRELRVAARKRSTFWLRVATAVAGVVIGSGCLLLESVQGAGPVQMGSALFYVLTWTCLAAGLSAGLFFTSDCLSEEKREGTLGLLFLTELRGHDVALGKLLATSLRGFYALLAVFPILAITQLMGGISSAQYWKSSLALVNAMFFSLAAGMLVSALSRDSQRALGATLCVLLLLALGGPLADTLVAGAKKRGFQPAWSLSSPGYVLVAASAWGRSAYWQALGMTHLLGWGMFALASALVPHTWQDRKRAGASSLRSWAYTWTYGAEGRRERFRRKLLDRQPLAWLAGRERWQSRVLWAMAILAVVGVLAVLAGNVPKEAWMVWTYVGGFFTLLLYLWAASQACRFLVKARRSGLLELLLVAPVTEKQIVGGHWRAWSRMFGLPVLLLLGVHVTGATLSQLSFQRLAAQVGPAMSPAVTNQSGTVTNQTFVFGATVTVVPNTGTNALPAQSGFQAGSTAQQVGMAVAAAAAAGLSTAANLLALCWFGMWMGMTSRTANLATLKTILFVQVLPWFVIVFGTSMVVGLMMAGFVLRAGASTPAAWFVWWPLLNAVLGAGMALAKDIGFIVWSRGKLQRSLREQAARSLGQNQFTPPPPLPAPLAPPPVMAAS